MKINVKLFSLIGILLFIFILTRIDLSSLFEIFLGINLFFLCCALIVNGIAIVVKSFKWKLIVSTLKKEISLSLSIRAFLIGFSFSVLTPAKLGDFVRAFYIRDEQCTLGKALSSVVTDRLIDIVTLFSFAFVGILVFSFVFHREILSVSLLVILAVAIASAVYIVTNKQLLTRLLRPFFNIFIPHHHKKTVSEYYHDFFSGLSVFFQNKKIFFLVIIVGIVSWFPPIVYAYLLALSLGISVDLTFFVIVIPIISLLDLLPISISGIGTRDAALIFLFGLQGIPPESAVAFSLLYLFMSYWLVALVGALFWIQNPIKMDGDER
jgi:uncharacterized protein (TIRG00374 family)